MCVCVFLFGVLFFVLGLALALLSELRGSFFPFHLPSVWRCVFFFLLLVCWSIGQCEMVHVFASFPSRAKKPVFLRAFFFVARLTPKRDFVSRLETCALGSAGPSTLGSGKHDNVTYCESCTDCRCVNRTLTVLSAPCWHYHYWWFAPLFAASSTLLVGCAFCAY